MKELKRLKLRQQKNRGNHPIKNQKSEQNRKIKNPKKSGLPDMRVGNLQIGKGLSENILWIKSRINIQIQIQRENFLL